MLTFVNGELFSYNARTEKNDQTGKSILQLKVATSNALVTYAKGSKMDKYHNPQESKDINPKYDIDMRDNPEIVPINRDILTVNYVSEDQLKDPSLLMTQATSLKVVENRNGIPVVSARCLIEDSPNKSNLYVVAYPFNGMLTPIENDPHYRIYKGMIMSSVRPFYFNGKHYRKILYLVIEPHMALFDQNHKYHTDHIDIKLESYAIFKDRESGDEKTNHEIFTLHLSDKISTSNWEYEVLNYPYKIEPSTGTSLWTTFHFKPNQGNRNFNNPQSRSQYNENDYQRPTTRSGQNTGRPHNGQKSGYVEGNTYVTTNRHGIRKEVPMGNNFSKYKEPNKDFDQMLKDSGMYDDYSDDRRNSRNNRKSGKKNYRKNRDDRWN